MPSQAGRSLALVLRGFGRRYREAIEQNTRPQCKALEKLVAQSAIGFRLSTEVNGLDFWQSELLHALGIRSDLMPAFPSAPLSWQGATGLEPIGTWLHADPAHMSMGSHDLSLRRLRVFSTSDLENIGARTAAHLASLQMSWHVARDSSFIRCANLVDVQTSTAVQAELHGLRAAMPTGTDAGVVKRLMAELQMLLQEVPTNNKPNAREPELNALWLWGAGRLNSEQLTSSAANELPPLWTDTDYARGVYKHINTNGEAAIHPLPKDVDAVIAGQATNSLVVVDSLDIAACESQWFEPLLVALNGKRIRHLSVFLDGWQIQVEASNWRRWFSRAKPLSLWAESSR